MRKILFFTLLCIISIGYSNAAVRDNNYTNREEKNSIIQRSSVVNSSDKVNSSRSATKTKNTVVSTNNSARNSNNVISRTVKSNNKTTSITRSAVNTISSKNSIPRSVSENTKKTTSTARSTTSINNTNSKTFGTGYNTCRDSYFTCMDQFCAKQDETYRRCVCSSRLEEIKAKERAISQTSEKLQDFQDLNIEVISKTNNEVKAMLNETTGEATESSTKDNSASASALQGISSVLTSSKSNSLSTQGKLDIAGDINSIWSTTDLTAGANISNLTGEKLYNAVHAQCVEFSRSSCESDTTLTMVSSAYGMYIENDCSSLANSLSNQISTASDAIRSTEFELNNARLENYDVHNSTSINNCIANVRSDITADSACGKDYVHCLDITGKYLNIDTGEPIYSAYFYQLETQTSLSGDILSNQTNRLLISELNKKKEFAKDSLSTCDDLSDNVWDEFLRQAIAEIYQGQQERIRQVKNECVDVVNDCYDTQSNSLKDFSNIKEQLLLGARLELSEEMCKEKLEACSNLYGGGETGLSELITTMSNLTDQKIAKNCKTTLEEYVNDICAVTSSDIIHNYPFACRTYAPGEQKYALIKECNSIFSNASLDTTLTETTGFIVDDEEETGTYLCPLSRQYSSCAAGYFLTYNGAYNPIPTPGNKCSTCPDGYECAGGTSFPIKIGPVVDTEDSICGDDYVGSLYQKLVRYAMQNCTRPSSSDEVIPTSVLGDVNTVMDAIKTSMATELANECDRLGGTWINTPGNEVNPNELLINFYEETSANNKWGYCANE